MGNAMITTEETRWLSQMIRMLRNSTSAIINGGGGGGSAITIAQFTIGDGNPATPIDGSDTYLNPLMDNKTSAQIHISKNGTGYLTEGTSSGEYQLVSGGGFQLQSGSVFSTDETYVVFIQ